MKKKAFILTLAIIVAAININAQQRFTIKGELPDSLDGARIELLDYEDCHICATTFLKNGRFEFKGEIQRDSICRIDVLHNEEFVNFAELIVEAGEITVDFSNNLAKGTPLNDAMASLDIKNKELELIHRRTAFRNDPSHSPEQIDSMENACKEEFQRIKTEELAGYIKAAKENNNALGCWAMWYLHYLLVDAPEQFLQIYSEASPYVQNYGLNLDIKQTMENQLTVRIGCKFKDLDFPHGNLDGTPAKLSDYVGRSKFILVDFWASSCLGCREETPNLKAVYDRFHGDRFDILSIAIGEKRENTLRMISEEKIPWLQILEAQSSDIKAYGLDGIPLIILFSPDGTILAYNLREEGIMKAVEEALAK